MMFVVADDESVSHHRLELFVYRRRCEVVIAGTRADRGFSRFDCVA